MTAKTETTEKVTDDSSNGNFRTMETSGTAG